MRAGGPLLLLAIVAGSCALQPLPPGSPCPPGQDLCGGPSCVDLGRSMGHCGRCGQSCGAAQVCKAGACIGGDQLQFVVDEISLPKSQAEFGADINGDGRLDNKFADFVSAIDSLPGMGPGIMQTRVRDLILSGSSVTLLAVPPLDAQIPEPMAILQGKQNLQPDFSGAGNFLVEESIPGTVFFTGRRHKQGYEATVLPPLRPPYFRLVARLSLGPGLDHLYFEIPFRCHRITFTTFDEGGGRTRLNGQLQGSIKKTDLDSKFAGDIARQLDQLLHDPDGQVAPGTKGAVALLDSLALRNGRDWCKNGDGTIANASDGRIDPCEIDVFMKAFGNNPDYMKPDVEIWRGDMFSPQLVAADPDSLSFGLGFAAISAKFR